MFVKDTKFCAIDIETTGLDNRKDEIIAFASIPIEGLKILIGRAYYTLIRPQTFKIESMKYHGIAKEDLRNAHTFDELYDQILKSMDGIIVGHSIDFDYRFLKSKFEKVGVKLKKEVVDIMVIEKWLGEQSGKFETDFTFESMINRYGLKESYRHHALADAFFAAQIFQIELLKLSELGIDSADRIKSIVKSRRYSI